MDNHDPTRTAELTESRSKAFKDLEGRRYDWYAPEPISQDKPFLILARGKAIGKRPDYFPGIADFVTRDTEALLLELRIEEQNGQVNIHAEEVGEDDD